MKKIIIIVLAYMLILLSLAYISAEYSIDISGLKQSYSVGEEISYQILLLENGKAIDKNIEVVFSNDLNKKEIRQSVISNRLNTLLVDKNFSSLGWHAKAGYEGKEVTRSFFIAEISKVEFVIEGNKFIIKNKGNVAYTRDVKVKIGEEENIYTQNIPIGGEKIWILVAPEGSYDIEVSDGITSFTKSNVLLSSPTTGNSIGLMSDEFSGTGFVTSITDPDNQGKSFISINKIPVAFIFIGAVAGLVVLLMIKRKVERKKEK